MQFIKTCGHGLAGITRQVIWEVPNDIRRSLYQNGPIQTLNYLAGDEGIDKVYKIAIWSLPLLSASFGDATKAFKRTLDISYGTMIVKNVVDSFVKRNRETGLLEFKLPPNDKLVSTVLLTMASTCKFFYISMYQLELFSIPQFTQISMKMGHFRLFHHQPFAALRVKPDDFLVFFGSFASSIETFYKNYENYQNPDNETYRRLRVKLKLEEGQFPAIPFWAQDIFSAANLLKHTSNFGKMTLSYFGPTHYSQPWFIVAAGVTNVASLLGTCLK